jgi:hypothetical protein
LRGVGHSMFPFCQRGPLLPQPGLLTR